MNSPEAIPETTSSISFTTNVLALHTKKTRSPYGYWERIPRWAIDDVVINPKMKADVTDPKLSYYLDEERLLAEGAIFGFGVDVGNVRHVQPPSMHRGAILKFATFTDEYGTKYGQIALKGSGVSAMSAGKTMNTDPVGFFGDRDAGKEMKFSNEFAEFGGRNGRVVGYITLDSDRFADWLYTMQAGPYYPSNHNKVVKYNGDKPTILVRTMGVERMEDYYTGEEGTFSKKNIIIRAAGLIRSEMENLSLQAFADKYSRITDPGAFYSNLKGVNKYNAMNSTLLLKLNAMLYGHNLGVLERLSVERYDSDLKPPPASLQNVDLAGFWYDWEQSTLPYRSSFHNPYKGANLGEQLIFNRLSEVHNLMLCTESSNPLLEAEYGDIVKRAFYRSRTV